jgi:hypothetical protein
VHGMIAAREGANVWRSPTPCTIPDRGLYASSSLEPIGLCASVSRRGNGVESHWGETFIARRLHVAHRGNHPRPGPCDARAGGARKIAVLARRPLRASHRAWLCHRQADSRFLRGSRGLPRYERLVRDHDSMQGRPRTCCVTRRPGRSGAIPDDARS